MYLTLRLLAIGLESVKASWTHLLCLSWLEFPALAFLEQTLGRSTIRDLLADFERVFVFADGDAPGREFAASLARELPVTTVTFGDGEDVNSAYIKYGKEFIQRKWG
jgi:hypothetical protein